MKVNIKFDRVGEILLIVLVVMILVVVFIVK